MAYVDQCKLCRQWSSPLSKHCVKCGAVMPKHAKKSPSKNSIPQTHQRRDSFTIDDSLKWLEMTEDELVDQLDVNGFKMDVCQKFVQNNVTGAQFLKFTDTDFSRIGIEPGDIFNRLVNLQAKIKSRQ